MVEKNTAHENKFKNFIERGKNFLGNAKLSLSSLYNQTKEKLIDTINVISAKILKLKKQTEEDIAELFSTTGTESQHDVSTDEIDGKADDICDVDEDKSSDTDGKDFVDEVEGVVDSEGDDEGGSDEGSGDEGCDDEGGGDQEDYSFDFFEDDIDDVTKQEIVRQIMEKEGKREYYAQGSEGIILKIEIDDDKGDKKEFLVAKKRYDHKTQTECKLHEAVQNLLPIGDNTVRVPELKAKISGLNGENYIIMEFINGKTIYQMTIEEILRKNGFGSFNFENDKEATNCFCKFLGVERNTEENLNLLDKKYDSLCKELKIFDSKTGKKYEKAMREFIKKMHDAGIYHRDLHQKNIIVGDDGKLYVIDFGKSLQLPQDGTTLSKKEIYEEQVGELTGNYVYDESGVSIIKGLTKNEDDEENEKWHENFVKKEKELTKKINSGESIISYFDTLPKGFRIKMEWDDFLKSVKREGKQSKRYSLDTMLDSKGDELVIYLFAQSLENIDNLLDEIVVRTKSCEEILKRNESDSRADQPLYRKKNITLYEKKIKGMAGLKKKLEKLKSLVK